MNNPWRLSPREKEVFRLLLDGRSQKEIGHELGIISQTVSNHVRSIRQKTGAANFVEMVLAALETGWIGMERAPKMPAQVSRPRVAPETFEIIRKLRADGRSYRQIARYLNASGTRTPHGLAWSPETVCAHMRKDIGKVAA